MRNFWMVNKLLSTIFAITFLSCTMFGQSPATFSGGGTGIEQDPYVILTVADWDAFAKSVNQGYTYEDKYIKLGRDIGEDSPVTSIVGTCDFDGTSYIGTQFDGNFDGDWHTITVDIQSDPNDPDYTAPFAWVNGATISNLHVKGCVTTTGRYAGGIVSCYEYHSPDESPIIMRNCTSSVEIVSKSEKDTNHGGMVGWICSGYVRFENCVFDGSIMVNAENCAGFVGLIEKWTSANSEDCHVAYVNCTQAHAHVDHNDKTTFGTFHLPTKFQPEQETGWNTAYYIHQIQEDEQGIQAPSKPEDGVISKIYEDKDHGIFYVPDATAVPTLSTSTSYIGTIPVKYYGKRLNDGDDYTVSVKKDNITITGKGDYAGSKTINNITFTPFTGQEWADVMKDISGVTSSAVTFPVEICLDRDYKGTDKDGAWVFNVGNSSKIVTLNLNEYTIDRNLYDPDNGIDVRTEDGYVICVAASTNLIINGPGVITGGNNKGKDDAAAKGDGGGVYVASKGTLTLNDVTITKNRATRSAPSASAKKYGTGAGVYSEGALTINDCIIVHNIGDGGGGGVRTNGGSFTMNRTYVGYNYVQSKGGGLRLTCASTLNDCRIENNIAEFMHLTPEADDIDGGGIYFQKTTTLNNCIINGNNAEWRGGGIFINDATVTMNNCKINYNSALGDEAGNPEFGYKGGGGAFLLKGTLDLNNTEITGNTSYTIGGVFIRPGHTLKVKGKTIIFDNIGDAIMPNVFLESPTGLITVSANLHESALIGVSRKGENETNVTTGLNGHGDGSNFHCDNYKLYWFTLNNGEIQLQKTKYWHTVNWTSDAYCHYDSKKKIYRIDAPVIVNQIQDISGDTIIFEDSNGNKSTRAAIFIDKTKEKINNSWVQHDGQLIYDGTPVKATVLRNVYAAQSVDEGTYGWYTISSPVSNPNLLHNTNFITAVSHPYNFDLLRFNADKQDYPWETYVAHPEFDTLENGIGYLYRNAKDFVAECTGYMNTGDVTVDLREGWNLIGNPYTHSIFKGDDATTCAIQNGKLLQAGYYQLANNGGWNPKTAIDDETEIMMGEGLLVKAEKDGQLIINNKAPKSKPRANKEYIKFIVANNDYEDATYAVFDEGYGLDKLNHRNPNIPMIYINQEDDDYAIAMMSDDVKSFNLNFKAMKTGKYTLKYKAGGDFSYLHVVDRLTGKDIDMLADDEYSFIGSPKDTDARFIVRLNYTSGNANNDIFAYQSGSDIVVCGEGELQVFDVMGRLISNQHVTGIETITRPSSTGVYILRLNDKVQKIVIK